MAGVALRGYPIPAEEATVSTQRLDIATRLPILIGASQTALSVRTSEDWRFRKVVEAAAVAKFPGEEVPVVVWDCVKGFEWNKKKNDKPVPIPFSPTEDYTGLLAALQAAADLPGARMPAGIFIFNDPHDFLAESVSCRRQIKNMVNELKLAVADDEARDGVGHKRMMILVHPGPLHPELLNYVVPIEFPLPSEEEHAQTIGEIRTKTNKTAPPELRAAMAAACVGLTWKQAEDTVSESMMRRGGLVPEILSSIEQTKADLLGQQGFLQYIPMEEIPPVDAIRGFEAVHGFLNMAAQAHLPKFAGMQLDRPKGVLLMGIAGTGKSMMGKLASRIFYDVTGKRFPLYLLNVPALFGGIVGQTEANVRWVTETLSAQGHYLLVIDELEKMLATTGFNGDSGVSLRAVGQILTWLSERVNNPRDKGYVVGTLNTIEGIRPEFFRRFDGVFYADLPTPAVRREILDYHFRARGVDPARVMDEAGWQTIVLATDRFIGSELEDVVIQSKWKAAWRRGVATPDFEEVEEAARDRATSIVSRTHGAMIEAIRDYCKTAARPVHVEQQLPRPERRRRVAEAGEN